MSSVLRVAAGQKTVGHSPAKAAPSKRNAHAPVSVHPNIWHKAQSRQRYAQLRGMVSRGLRVNCVADQVIDSSIFLDSGTGIIATAECIDGLPTETVAGAYAFYDDKRALQFVGVSQNIQKQLQEHIKTVPQQLREFLRLRVLKDATQATEEQMVAQAREWIQEAGGELPPGNSTEAHIWGPAEDHPAPLPGDATTAGGTAAGGAAAAAGGGGGSGGVVTSPFSRVTVHRQVGESAVKEVEMSVESVDRALNDIRQYLFADGGDIRVIRVENGKVYVQFEGACSSCSSQETTMTMGVQRALSAAFGEQLQEVVQVEEEGGVAPGGEGREMTVAGVESLLALLRPAVANYGGTVEVASIEGGKCSVRYKGPDAIWTGVKMAIHDKFGDEVDDVIRVEVDEEDSSSGEKRA